MPVPSSSFAIYFRHSFVKSFAYDIFPVIASGFLSVACPQCLHFDIYYQCLHCDIQGYILCPPVEEPRARARELEAIFKTALPSFVNALIPSKWRNFVASRLLLLRATVRGGLIMFMQS